MTRHIVLQDQEELEKSEYPMLVKTFRRVMEKQVMQSPPKKRDRTRTPQGLTGSVGYHGGEYLGQFGPGARYRVGISNLILSFECHCNFFCAKSASHSFD